MEKKIFLVVANDKHIVCATFSNRYASLVARTLSLRVFKELGVCDYAYIVVAVPFVHPYVSEL